MQELDAFQVRQGVWSDSTFGKGDGRGALNHLKREVEEVHEARGTPDQLVEYADCLMLLFDAARRDGFKASDVLQAAWAKLRVNLEREWGDRNEDGSVEHVRDEAPKRVCAYSFMEPSDMNLTCGHEKAPAVGIYVQHAVAADGFCGPDRRHFEQHPKRTPEGNLRALGDAEG